MPTGGAASDRVPSRPPLLIFVALSDSPSPKSQHGGDGLDWWLACRALHALVDLGFSHKQGARLSYSHVLLLCCIIRYI